MKQSNLLPVSRRVEDFVKNKPFVQEAVEQGIVNFSSLARLISKDLGGENFNAVKAALLRANRKLVKQKKQREKKVIALLRNSSFEMKNKVAALHSATPLDLESIASSFTPSGYVYFLEERAAEKLKHRDVEGGFAIIHLKNRIEIEYTPGVVAFIFSALASENINVVHLLDCREDTFIVIKESDAPLAFSVLAERLRI